MNFPFFFRRHVAIFLIVFSLALGDTRAAEVRSGPVTQVLLFWLKRPENVDDQNFLLRGLRSLRRVRGVSDVRAGRQVPVSGPGFESSFDIGLVMIFRDRDALEKFERDPHRRQALDAMLQPLVRRYVVYNFVNE
jgi:hypothetical protein